MISTLVSASWDAVDLAIARDKFIAAKSDMTALIQHTRDMLAPVDKHWLVRRLELLWKSTIPAGALSAEAWLSETGRLIQHLPFDIASHAIDQAVRTSGNGFTPTAGEILAQAKQLLEDRRRILHRLKDVAAWGAGPTKQDEMPPEDRCTPEQAAAVLAEAGFKSRYHRDPPRMPTEEELAALAREAS